VISAARATAVGALAIAIVGMATISCAIPAVSANSFLPAGDLHPGDFRASASMEAGRVLASPSDLDLTEGSTPEPAQKYQVSTWVASDLSLDYGVTDRISIGGQLKLTNPIDPFTLDAVGGAFGARFRLCKRTGDKGLSIELGTRFVGVRAEQEVTQVSGVHSQTDRWTYRALGAEVPLIISYRLRNELALTVSPFLRTYLIRAWHDVILDQASTTTSRLQWTPVISGGLGVSVAVDFGALELSPALAVELATRAGPNAPLQLLFEPGLAVGYKF
jgi:hypothetical protein